MSFTSYLDGSIKIDGVAIIDTEESTVSLTGAFNATITVKFARTGNIATIKFPIMTGLETGLGGVATGAISFPLGFEPADLPSVDNPTWGIGNLAINGNTSQRTGTISITNGILTIGTFDATGTTTNTIGIYGATSLPYICL